jgi:hypothetical protein
MVQWWRTSWLSLCRDRLEFRSFSLMTCRWYHPSSGTRFCSISASPNIHGKTLCTTLVKLWYYYLLLIQYITNKCSIPNGVLSGSLCPDATISSTPCNPQSALGSVFRPITQPRIPSSPPRPSHHTQLDLVKVQKTGQLRAASCANPTRDWATPWGPYRPSCPIRVL